MTNVLIGGYPTNDLTADQQTQGAGFGLGDRYTDAAGREYVYVVLGAGGVTGPGYVVSIDANFTAVMTTNAASLFGQQVGVAQTAAAAGSFIWVQIYGNTQVWTDVAVVAVRMQTTTTAGQIDDAAGTGTKQIPGLSLTAARVSTAGLAPAILTYPTIGATN